MPFYKLTIIHCNVWKRLSEWRFLGGKILTLQIKFNSSLCNAVGNLCSPLMLLVWTSWPGGGSWVGCWELLSSTGSLPVPMTHRQLSMHGLHCTVKPPHFNTCVTAGWSLWVTKLATTPTQLFPFQPERIPFLQQLIEIGPSTFIVPQVWAFVIQRVFWWVICILMQHNLQCFSWGSDCTDKWSMFICWIEKNTK